MNFVQSLCKKAINFELNGAYRNEIISKLVSELVKADPDLEDLEESITEQVIKREEMQPTGIENGLAVPHAKVAGLKRFYSTIGIHKDGVDFGANDKEPSHIIILLVSPKEENVQHVKILSQIAKLTRNKATLEKMKACESVEEMMQIIEKHMELLIR